MMTMMCDTDKPEVYFYTITLYRHYLREGEPQELEEFYFSPKDEANVIPLMAEEIFRRGWFPVPGGDLGLSVEWVRRYVEVASININYTGAGPWDVSATNWMELPLVMWLWHKRGVFAPEFWDTVHGHCTDWERKKKGEAQ